MKLLKWKAIRELHGSSNVVNYLQTAHIVKDLWLFACSKQHLDEYQSPEFLANLCNTGHKPTDQLPAKQENQSLSNGGE